MKPFILSSMLVFGMLQATIAQSTPTGKIQILEKLHIEQVNTVNQPTVTTASTTTDMASVLVTIIENWGISALKLVSLLIGIKPIQFHILRIFNKTEFYSSLADLTEPIFQFLVNEVNATL